MLTKLAEIANTLDAQGKHEQADKVTSLMVAIAKKNNENMPLADKILSLLEKEGIKCPECGGDMEFDSNEDNYGMCNCGDENCDCTIDLVDEVNNFLDYVDGGDM
jgi:hypothetical protein